MFWESTRVKVRASIPETGFEKNTFTTASWYTWAAPGTGYVAILGAVLSGGAPSTLITQVRKAMGTGGAPSTTGGSVLGLRPSHRPPRTQGSSRKLLLVSARFPRNFNATIASND